MSNLEFDHEELTNRIRTILEEEDYTPSSFAEKIEISTSRMTHILNGRNRPTLDIVYRIAVVFPHRPLSWLLFGEMPDSQREMPLSSSGSTMSHSLFSVDSQTAHNQGNELCSQNPQGATPQALLFTPEEATTIRGLVHEALQLKVSKQDERSIDEIRIFYSDDSYEIFKKV